MVKDQGVALGILEATACLISAAEHLWDFAGEGNYAAFERTGTEMLRVLQGLTRTSLYTEVIESIVDSLKRIMVHAKGRSDRTFDKIEFELLPLMKDLYINFYFYACLYPEKPLMEEYYGHEMARLGANQYIDRAIETKHYKYDLSVSVLAFNKLEYTKLCVENLLRYIPQDLNYELILTNHGSTDGTKEFFESIASTKQLDIWRNGGGLGAQNRIFEGKYYLEVSNDVIVTENAIANLIRCMESDEKIAWVVPTTPNVSNFQTIPAEYRTIEEMQAFARENNQRSNPYRWEQRVRLCNPISLRRTDVSFSSGGIHWPYYYHTHEIQYFFVDDRESMLYRRNGYKMMLAKDSYCYHFGSVTLKDGLAAQPRGEQRDAQNSSYGKGRKLFFDAFGIDPWGTGVCWSGELMSLLPCQDKGHIDILGVNCGIGSNPLKVKESLKENARNLDVTLYNVTDDRRYAKDLKGVSDVFTDAQGNGELARVFPGVRFNYIVFESGLETLSAPLERIKELKKRLATGGVLALRTAGDGLKEDILKNYSTSTAAGDWCVIYQGS